MKKRFLVAGGRTLAYTVSAMLLMTACAEKKQSGFTVSGTYSNADRLAFVEGPVQKVYLVEVPYAKNDQGVILDSARISGSHGQFSLNTPVKAQQLYELVFGNNALGVPLVNDAPEVKVSVDLGKRDDFYTVSGSEASGQLKDLINVFGKKNFEVERAMADLDSVKRINGSDSAQLAMTGRKNAAVQDMNTYLKQFMNTNSNPTLCALALNWASQSFSKTEFESALKDLVAKYPENQIVAGIKKSWDQQLTQMANEQGQPSQLVGKQAPELTLPDVDGKPVSISSFRGKYLLVDFWASWCGPCRMENPNVVAAYAKFKNKNFAILGVSLDKDKEHWVDAIRQDRLEWTHISDLKYWGSKAVEVYGFNGIPYNVLIDPQGKIIAEKLRGEDLENKLKEVLH